MKLKNPFKKEYIDLRTNTWRSNYLIGLKIIKRPWKKSILIISLLISLFSLIIPDLGLMSILGIKFLGKYG